MDELRILEAEYRELLDEQRFIGAELDYSVAERHIRFLQQLSEVGNSGITLFDMNKREHIFTSYNFSNLFGFDLDAAEQSGTSYFNSRVHPADLIDLSKTGNMLLRYMYRMPADERKNYKLINEYRILNNEGKYIRVIEQHQALELDDQGNIWLAIGVIDLSPDQGEFHGVKYQLLNFVTGELVCPAPAADKSVCLTPREREILHLIKDGFLSKEISDRLSISVHTVNTHRQRILEKLNAGNSMEAVNYAARLGLLF